MKQLIPILFYNRVLQRIEEDLVHINHKLNHQAMTINEIKANVDLAVAKLQKARDEILAEIQKLKDSLANAELPQEAVDALEALAGAAQGLDDIVPDPAPEPTPEEPQQ